MQLFPAKTSLTIVTLVVMLVIPDYIPAFKDYRVFEWSNASVVFDFHPRMHPGNPVEEEQERLKPDTEELRTEAHPLVDPHHQLDHFFAKLLRTERQEAGARVGAILMCTLFGMALGGWLSGAIFDWTGSYRAAFLNGTAWNLVNVSIVLMLIFRARSSRKRGVAAAMA